MFCARCGEQIPDASEICRLCGQEATLKVDAPPPLPKPAAATSEQINWPEEPILPSPPPRRPELRGVGGWLLFFCISQTMLAPLVLLIRVWVRGFQINSAFDLALAAVSILTGTLLWNVHPRAFTFLWIYFGLTLTLTILEIVRLAVANGTAELRIGTIVKPFVFIVIWVLYFKQSDRVQATFGRNL